jgi:hypothetical protein
MIVLFMFPAVAQLVELPTEAASRVSDMKYIAWYVQVVHRTTHTAHVYQISPFPNTPLDYADCPY